MIPFPSGGRDGGNKTAGVRLPFRALCPAIVTVIESILDESRSNSSPCLLVRLPVSSFLCVSSRPSPFFPSFADTRIIRYHQTPFVAFASPLQMTTIIQNINERERETLPEAVFALCHAYDISFSHLLSSPPLSLSHLIPHI